MTRESVLIILGLILALSPFLGLPYTWLMVLVPALSLAVVVIGIALRKKRSEESRETYEAPEA